MTFQIGFLFALLGVMVYLFLTEKLSVDLTAALGLVTLLFLGYLKPAEAFTGFMSPAVITMASVFVVGAALLETGMADAIGGRIHKIVGNSEVALIVTLMIVAGIMSAFMNNIAATAVLMPAVAAIGPKAGLAPSRLFMPLAFGAILGGTTTLVGTPPNILAGELLENQGLESFSLFDFTPLGIAILALGTLYMITIGRKLLPVRENRGPRAHRAGDLTQVYQLQERLFSIRVPEGSPLHGRTLAETRLGNTLGVKVVAIQHDGHRTLAPAGDAVLYSGDLLFVDGKAGDVQELLRLQGLAIQAGSVRQLPAFKRGVGAVRARIAGGSPLVGHDMRELRFRDRFGLVVVAIQRGDELIRSRIGQVQLQTDDVILALGTRKRLTAFASEPDFVIEKIGLSAISDVQEDLFWIYVPEASPLAGTSIEQSRLGELVGLTVAGLIRGDRTYLAVEPDEVIQAGDRLLIGTSPKELESLLELGDVELDADARETAFESEDVGMVEISLAPRSTAAGKTLAELDFRERFGLLAVALWRQGKVVHSDLAHVQLQFGDALLLQGAREKILKLAQESDFVVLTEAELKPVRKSKAGVAIGGLLLMIGLVVSGYQPIHIAAFTAAAFVVLFGALTMQESYRAIEWRAILLVACVLPVGIAMERTGAAKLMATSVAEYAGPLGPHVILAALVVLASALSQGLDGAPAIVLLAPVVFETATNLDISPYPLMMGASLAASAAFMTPFSHKANLLVMGAGGYRSSDYLKVGTPLTLLIYILLVVLVPVFFPF